ncbi:MAG: hypothetical protein BroJett040_23110 [Oligoflexia bacterium]|nr:MAG: hypothetical protein BroJett040_23110 [Oligoflexia bacterium]
MDHGKASWNIYQYVALLYRIDENQKISIRPAFNTQTGGSDQFGKEKESKTSLADFHMTYSNYTLATLPGEWDLSGTFYIYWPTSESSQQKKWISRVQSWLIFDKKLDRNWSVTYNMKPDYYFHTQKSYRAETVYPDGGRSVRSDNNMIGKLDHYVSLSRYLNKVFTPGIDIGLSHEWYYGSEEANSKSAVAEYFKMAPNTWIMLSKRFKFIAGIENRIDLRDRRGEDFQLFRDKETSYYIMSFISLM